MKGETMENQWGWKWESDWEWEREGGGSASEREREKEMVYKHDVEKCYRMWPLDMEIILQTQEWNTTPIIRYVMTKKLRNREGNCKQIIWTFYDVAWTAFNFTHA